MNRGDLIQLGLAKNESEIYMVLIRFKEADAHHIISETKFHKKIVYDNLQRLIDKGLVTSVIKGNKSVFSLAPSGMLSAYIEEQEKAVQKRKEIALKIKKEIESNKELTQEKQEATVYSGIQAVKAFYAETLGSGNYYVLGAPRESVDIMGEIFWDNYHAKRKKNKQKVNLLLNQSLRGWGQQQKDQYMNIGYFDEDFEPKTEIHIQNNVVGIIVWTKNPVIFKMTSEVVADSYKKYFERMWKNAKK